MTLEASQTAEFSVDSSDATGALLRVVVLMSSIGGAIVVSSFVAGAMTGLDAVMVAILLALGTTGFCVNMWLIRRGVARLTPARLEIRAWSANQFYAWNDIAEVRVRCLNQMWLPDRLLWKATGVDLEHEIVVLRPSRSLRFGLLPFQHGTDIVGAPTGFRTVRVFVSDPAGFANAVEKWLPGRVRYS